MNKWRYWGQSVVLLGAIAFGYQTSVLAAIYPLASTSVQSEAKIQLAQTLLGQCRAANKNTFIYNEPSLTGTRVRSLLVDERVTLADSGRNGWIAINEPISGFIQTNDLKACEDRIVGQCRAAKQSTFIYDGRSTTSTRLRSLVTNEQVSLASGGTDGWIAISSPVRGFVQTIELKPCGPQTGTPPAPRLCRRVTPLVGQEGLNVRTRPTTEAPKIGVLVVGDLVRLRTSPPAPTVDNVGRSWLEITSPLAGWVSNGLGGGGNLEPIPCP